LYFEAHTALGNGCHLVLVVNRHYEYFALNLCVYSRVVSNK